MIFSSIHLLTNNIFHSSLWLNNSSLANTVFEAHSKFSPCAESSKALILDFPASRTESNKVMLLITLKKRERKKSGDLTTKKQGGDEWAEDD
jgi:hypothetical protein